MTASLEMKLVSATGYKCETTYEIVTPEQWGNVVRVLEGIPQPDCRTCVKNRASWCLLEYRQEVCTNGDKYQPAPKVVLWRTES